VSGGGRFKEAESPALGALGALATGEKHYETIELVIAALVLLVHR